MSIQVELRCPIGPRMLFAKLLTEGGSPTITGDNLVEFACPECKKRAVRQGEAVVRVLHRFNLAGVLVESVYVRPS